MEFEFADAMCFALKALLNSVLTTGIVVLVGLAFKSSLAGYLGEKAKNFATKQDIAELTELQRKVEHKFDLMIERVRSEEQMRSAVVEGRFRRHQEAYTLWIELVNSVHSVTNAQVARKCQDWWEANNLYLDPDARIAFKHACLAAFHHPEFLKAPRDADSSKQVKDNWEVIMNLGPLIEKAVALPSIGVFGFKNADEDKNENGITSV